MGNNNKIIIHCPGCKHKVRVPKHKNINFTCPSCKNQVNYDGRINKKPYYIGGFILVLAIAYFSFFGDYFTYLSVKNNKTQAACSKYMDAYPKGYFIEEVSFIEITINEDIDLVRTFLNTYPNSEKKSAVLKVNQDLWDVEIEKYNANVKDKEDLDPKAVSFFRSLLSYMRDHNEANIILDFKGNVAVKNFKEYTPIIRNKLDSVYSIISRRTISDNIIDIKTNYSQGNVKAYENIVSSAVETSFENILSHKFIRVTSGRYYESPLKITITYDIRNQETTSLDKKSNYPVIWTYSKGESRDDFISFLIGVSINYSFNIALPNSDENFSFKYKTNALDNINNITSIEEGYRRMTSQNFYNYSRVISTKFGMTQVKEEQSE